jgi:hypothetical protein
MPTVALVDPPAARIDQVLNSFAMLLAFALQPYDFDDVTVLVGKPGADDTKKALANGQAFVYIEDGMSRPLKDKVRLGLYYKVKPTVLLTSSVDDLSVLTFGGSPQADINVNLLINRPPQVVHYQTTSTDTSLAIIAQNVAAQAVADGIAATASGATVTFPPTTFYLKCNLGGTGYIQNESNRHENRVSVVVLAPTSNDEESPLLGLRTAIGNPIIAKVGTWMNDVLPIDDGTQALVNYVGDHWINESMSDFDVFEWHIDFTVEYGDLNTTPATQIGVISQNAVFNGSTETLTRVQG